VTYAAHRRIIDADSHLIELDDFLANHASDTDQKLLPTMDSQDELPVEPAAIERARELLIKRQSNPDTMAKFEANLMDAKRNGWSRLGAWDPTERSHTMDLFGFEQQLVLPTFSFHQVAHQDDPAVLAAGARTLNRAMGAFCAHDERLHAIGYVPMQLGPEKAGELMDQGFAEGCYSFMVDTNEPNPKARSFTHPDFDPVWARFAGRTPAIFHVAVNGEYDAVSPSFRNNRITEAALGGDAPAGALGMVALKNSAELFMSALIFDGVFDRHPDLRGLNLEHGAVWLPSWLQTIDMAAHTFRMQSRFKERTADPSDYARKHLKFAPFAHEPVGWIVESIGVDMLVFGSDYPHPEGTSNPIERFEKSMAGCDEATFDAFYHGNMQEVMGLSV